MTRTLTCGNGPRGRCLAVQKAELIAILVQPHIIEHIGGLA